MLFTRAVACWMTFCLGLAGSSISVASVSACQKEERLGVQEVRDESGETCKNSEICVTGPCKERSCCEPFAIDLPDVLDPKIFTPTIRLRLFVSPNGNVSEVEVLKSTGLTDVDKQFVDGAKKWCFETTEGGMQVDWRYTFEF